MEDREKERERERDRDRAETERAVPGQVSGRRHRSKALSPQDSRSRVRGIVCRPVWPVKLYHHKTLGSSAAHLPTRLCLYAAALAWLPAARRLSLRHSRHDKVGKIITGDASEKMKASKIKSLTDAVPPFSMALVWHSHSTQPTTHTPLCPGLHLPASRPTQQRPISNFQHKDGCQGRSASNTELMHNNGVPQGQS